MFMFLQVYNVDIMLGLYLNPNANSFYVIITRE